MLRSYQPHIWRVCWANPRLATLELEMALAPLTLDGGEWRQIDATWRPSRTPCPPLYLGAHGRGELHEEFGAGEYLDGVAIGSARCGETRYLSLHTLTLMGFVVDAEAFAWFDPTVFRTLVFRDHCVDAGFALPPAMRVRVCYAGTGGARRVRPGEVRLVHVQRGCEASLTVNRGMGLKKKLSGLLPRWRQGVSI